MFLKNFKCDSRGSKIHAKGVSRQLQGSFKDVLWKFQGWLKKVSSVFRENVTKSFKGVSKMFLRNFVLQFCC